MSNFKLVKTAAALALGASVVTSSVATTDVSAASKYKIKSGKLVYAKSGKVVKGYATYKSTVYKNGKKFTGLKSKVYYKSGKKATGTYKGAYYVKGAKKVTTGTYNKAYYVKGVKKVTTGLYASKYYKDGKLATGTYKGAYYVNGVKKVTTGTYNKAYYVKGVKKVTTGTYAGAYYVKGVKKVTTGTYAGAYYVKGVKKVTTGIFEDKLYVAGKENTGLYLFENVLYDGVKASTGIKEFEGKWYNDSKLATGTIEGIEYENGVIIVKYGAIESVAAINATDATVAVTLDKEVSAEDLKNVKLSLKGVQDLTATFTKVEGKVAVFKVDQDILNKAAYDGEYTVTSKNLTGEQKTTYSAVIAGTMVEGFAQTTVEGKLTPLSNATVKVDGKTTATDVNGYYQLAVNPGAKTVEISKGNDYFVQEATGVVVERNNSTVVNKDLVAVDATKLFFTGTVLDSKDSKAVAGVHVQLQQKNANGEWVDVVDYDTNGKNLGETTTDAKGQFQFGNTGTAVSKKFTKNILAVGQEFRTVVEKKVSASNLDDVYKKQVVSFTVSNKKEETTKLVSAEKVAELEALSISATSLDQAKIEGDVTVDFIDTDGEVVLEKFKIEVGDGKEAAITDDGKSFKEPVEVVADKPKFANDASDTKVKPRLVSGTYFARVSNGTNAVKAYAVEVTEGGKASVKFEMEAAKTVQAKTVVDKVQYKKSLAALNDLSGVVEDDGTSYPTAGKELTEINKTLQRQTDDYIKASYAAYQTVAGKDIKIIETKPEDAKKVEAKFDGSFNVAEVSAPAISLTGLAGSVTYKVKSENDFLVGNKELTVKPDAATNNVTASLNAAAKLTSIKLLDKSKTGDVGISGDVVVKSLKLVDDKGVTVAEAIPNKKVLDAAINTDGTMSLTALDSTATSKDISSKFAGIKAGKYKLTVEVEGYESATSAEKEIIDFQNGEISVKAEPLKGNVVTGYVRFADNGKNVADNDSLAAAKAEASIIAYDASGKVADAVDFGESTTLETTYALKKLNPGQEYTFVVRGKGFETQVVKKTVVANDITTLNFDVVRGGDGQFKLQMVDSNNAVLEDSKLDYTVTDAYYTSNVTGIEFDGDYELKTPSDLNAEAGTDLRTYKVTGVSAGAYTLKVSGKNGQNADKKYVLDQKYGLLLKDINGTSYSTSTGVEIIKVPLINNALDVSLNLTFVGDAVTTPSTTDIDYVQVIDAAGNIVKTVRPDFDAFSTTPATNDKITIKVPNNATYTVKTFLNNGFVTNDVLTVQNIDVKKTINVDEAKR